MRVDAHHHLWDLGIRDQSWITGAEMARIRRNFSIDDLSPLAKQSRVDATVLVQTITVPEETPEFLAVAAQSDLVQAVVGWVDLTAADVVDQLAALVQRPDGQWLRGIRHQVQGEPDPDWLTRPDVRRGLIAVGQANLIYELLTLPHQLPAAIHAVRELPEVTFVLDHCSKPPVASGELEPWASSVRQLAAYDNVTCKLSGLVTEASLGTWTVEGLKPYVDVVLAAFGPDRLMFGSDWPVCLLAADYAEVVDAAEQLTAHLTPAEHDQVFGTTAARIYRLTPSP